MRTRLSIVHSSFFLPNVDARTPDMSLLLPIPAPQFGKAPRRLVSRLRDHVCACENLLGVYSCASCCWSHNSSTPTAPTTDHSARSGDLKRDVRYPGGMELGRWFMSFFRRLRGSPCRLGLSEFSKVALWKVFMHSYPRAHCIYPNDTSNSVFSPGIPASSAPEKQPMRPRWYPESLIIAQVAHRLFGKLSLLI